MDIVKTVVLIIAGSVALQAMGSIWYGPLFGKIWLRSLGKKSEDLTMNPQESRAVYGGSFFVGLVVCSFLYMIASFAMAGPGNSPLTIGLSASIFTIFIAGFASLPSYLFEKRPVMVWAIFYSYIAIAYGLISFVYAFFA